MSDTEPSTKPGYPWRPAVVLRELLLETRVAATLLDDLADVRDQLIEV